MTITPPCRSVDRKFTFWHLAHQKVNLGTLFDFLIARKSVWTTKLTFRLYAYDAYLSILSEGTEPFR